MLAIAVSQPTSIQLTHHRRNAARSKPAPTGDLRAFGLLFDHNQRFAFLDDVRCQFGAGFGSDVLRDVRNASRDIQRVTGLQRDRWLPFQLIFERAVDDISYFHAWMGVVGRRDARIDINPYLNLSLIHI